MKVVVLNENKQGYEPSDQEITQYGQFLGLKFPQDDKFIPLLYEALKAPLPPGWEACQTDDQNRDFMYRNKMTGKFQYEHPLDNFYRQKIAKIKDLTQNLQIQTILEQKQSWLKESSEYFGKSKQLSNPNENKEGFIDQIQEQRSLYGSQFYPQSASSQKQYIINKAIKSPRIYTKAKKNKLGDIREELNNFCYVPTFSLNEVRQKRYPTFNSEIENKKMNQLKELNDNIEKQKAQLKQLHFQRERKLKWIESLKNQIKVNQK